MGRRAVKVGATRLPKSVAEVSCESHLPNKRASRRLNQLVGAAGGGLRSGIDATSRAAGAGWLRRTGGTSGAAAGCGVGLAFACGVAVASGAAVLAMGRSAACAWSRRASSNWR